VLHLIASILEGNEGTLWQSDPGKGKKKKNLEIFSRGLDDGKNKIIGLNYIPCPEMH
jgi:hypothetical protein